MARPWPHSHHHELVRCGLNSWPTVSEAAWEVIMGNQLSVSQLQSLQWVTHGSKGGEPHPGLPESVRSQQVWGSDPSLLFGTSETVSGVLCPVWGSPVQERAWYAGTSPVEGHHNGCRLVTVYDDCGRKKCFFMFLYKQQKYTFFFWSYSGNFIGTKHARCMYIVSFLN